MAVDKAKMREDLRHMMRREWKRTWRWFRTQWRILDRSEVVETGTVERIIRDRAEREGFALWMVHWFLDGSNLAAWMARKLEVACNRLAARIRRPGTPRIGRVTSVRPWIPGRERTVTRRRAKAEWMPCMNGWRIVRVLTPFSAVVRNSRTVYWSPTKGKV